MVAAALEITNLHAWYGETHILHGVNLSVMPGEVAVLLGLHGSGCTTTLRAILGLAGNRQGSIRVHGTEIINTPTYGIAHLGIGYYLEEQGTFSNLTCEENLLLPLNPDHTPGGGMSLTEIYDIFPTLHKERASLCRQLSIGEQQMLKIARVLRTGANLLLLDEMSDKQESLIIHDLIRMITALKEKGYTLVLTEHNLDFPRTVADRYYVLEQGKITDAFQASELASKQDKLSSLLGL